nr:zinc finger, CCHC-type [Tanacetum cinerariifolium]
STPKASSKKITRINNRFNPTQLGSHLCIEESLRAQDSDKGKGKEVGGPSVNMTEEGGKNKHHKQNKGIAEVIKRTTQMLVVREKGLRTNPKTKVDAIAWWIDSGATTHVCKIRCWFKTFEPVEDEYVLYMGDEHFAPVHGKGSVALEFSFGKTVTLFNVLYVPKLHSVCMSSSTVVNSSLWHARLGHVYYKRMLEMSKDDLIPAIDENPKKCTTCMLMKITRKPFKTITRKSVILELIHSDLCDFHATPSLGYLIKGTRLLHMNFGIRNDPTWHFSEFWGCRAVVRLPDPKRKTLGEKGIDCIFVGYVEHSKAYRPKDIIPNSDESQRDDLSYDVPNEIPEPRKGKRVWKAKSYGSDFQLYLVEGSRDQVGLQYSYCYSIEEDHRTYNEVMQSQDSAFWKEAIDDEIRSIMENNTW